MPRGIARDHDKKRAALGLPVRAIILLTDRHLLCLGDERQFLLAGHRVHRTAAEQQRQAAPQ